jgi:hypothetical protein
MLRDLGYETGVVAEPGRAAGDETTAPAADVPDHEREQTLRRLAEKQLAQVAAHRADVVRDLQASRAREDGLRAELEQARAAQAAAEEEGRTLSARVQELEEALSKPRPAWLRLFRR